jgi:phosphonopyruvate decarboxylase
LLDVIGVKYFILDDQYENQVNACLAFIESNKTPVALIVKKDAFSKYECNTKLSSAYNVSRESALEIIGKSLSENDFIVSTTGKTSRELFEIRKVKNQNHSQDLLVVGSMGHAASLAFGISMGCDKNVFCIDGDGACLMHMGGLAVIAQNARSNFKYILINNGAHQSVGNQATVAFNIGIDKVLRSFGFNEIYTAKSESEIIKGVKALKNNDNLSALVINVGLFSRDNLGRPTYSPKQNKIDFMESLGRYV